jgi:hypothetical protein
MLLNSKTPQNKIILKEIPQNFKENVAKVAKISKKLPENSKNIQKNVCKYNKRPTNVFRAVKISRKNAPKKTTSPSIIAYNLDMQKRLRKLLIILILAYTTWSIFGDAFMCYEYRYWHHEKYG